MKNFLLIHQYIYKKNAMCNLFYNYLQWGANFLRTFYSANMENAQILRIVISKNKYAAFLPIYFI